jgi:hypothetical protein
MLDIDLLVSDVLSTKGRRLHSLIDSLEKSEQDAHNYLNAKTFANNIKLRSCPPVNEARDTLTSDTLPSSSFIVLMSSLQYSKSLMT